MGETFRSVLSSEPPSAPGVPLDIVMLLEIIPEATLQRCIKIADEAPADLKSNLRRAYGKFSPEDIEKCQKQKEFRALFSRFASSIRSSLAAVASVRRDIPSLTRSMTET